MFSSLHFFLLVLGAAIWQTEAGSLVVIGGGLSENNTEIWGRFIYLADGPVNAHIGVVTAASDDPLDSWYYYQEILEDRYGVAEAYWIPVTEGNKSANSDPDVVDNTYRMNGFFFGGGDQRRIINALYNNGSESPVLEAIKSRFTLDNAVIAGTSAGAAALSSGPMPTGGRSYEALLNGAFPEGDEGAGPDDLTYHPDGGIRVFHNFLVDQHFSERGREGRAFRLVWETKDLPNGVLYGVGVDEDTALVITDANVVSAEGEVLGTGGVMLYDVTNAYESSGAYFALQDVRVNYLTHGDMVIMRVLAITFDSSWKYNLAGNETTDHALSSDNIFDGTMSQPFPEFQNVTRSLFEAGLDSMTDGYTIEAGPQFRVHFEQDIPSEGWGGISPKTGQWMVSYSRVWCDLYEA